MKCDAFRAAILDAAAGVALAAAAEAHLAGCAFCRQAFERERALLLRIDRELGESLQIEPSPSVLPLIRARAERERARGSAWTLRWLLPALAAGLALVAVAKLVRGPVSSPEQPPVAAVTPRAPGAAPLAPPPGSEAEASARPPEPRRTAIPVPADEPEVLVPADEEVALRRLVARLRTGQVEPASVVVAEAGPPPLEDLLVVPLEIQPLSPESSR